jgi:uncharacterized protein
MQKVTFSGFAWDKANHSKCQKHGVSVAEVEHVLAHAATLIVPDLKNSRAEPRFLAIGQLKKDDTPLSFSRRGKHAAEYSCGP